MGEVWRTVRGVVRSLRTYYGNGARRAAMDRLYGRFVEPGDLVFDIGAHVGDRIAAFRRLGARVVAVEPQPALIKTLKLLYGRDRAVAIEPVAVGHREGWSSSGSISTIRRYRLLRRLSCGPPTAHPAGKGKPGPGPSTFPITTLDALVARHGTPSFIKIDVEGFEAEALRGADAARAGLVVRVHHHCAGRGECMHRALRRARIRPIQRE